MSNRRPNGLRRAALSTLTSAALAVALFTAMPPQSRAQETLNIVTFDGAYGRAQESAVLEPFARETGIAIATEFYTGDTAKLKRLIENGKNPVDVVDLAAETLKTFCDQGLLQPLDPGELKIDEESRGDFLPGAVSKCGVASLAWSMAIAFNKKAFRRTPPASIAALLDTKSYPGKRALPDAPERTLELVLLADGVSPSDIYRELATNEGADRAFAALDKIKGNVLLWNKPTEAMSWIVEGRAAMAAGYSGRLFRAATGNRNVGILWDGQIYDIDAWAIPKTSKSKEAAMRFIVFATAPAQLAAQARLTAYGPMRASALAQVGKHPVLGTDMQKFLPTAPRNFANALKFDQIWWDQNGGSLKQRFSEWAASLEAPPEGAAAPQNGTADSTP
ncbi:MAG: extracellular solute-binding protein [Pseudomonadota bacterium]